VFASIWSVGVAFLFLVIGLRIAKKGDLLEKKPKIPEPDNRTDKDLALEEIRKTAAGNRAVLRDHGHAFTDEELAQQEIDQRGTE